MSGLCLDVQGEGAFPAVGQCQRQVDAAPLAPDPLGRQAAVRVALEALDVDDVGPPVGQQCARHRHEDPLRQLDDAHAFECSFRVIPPLTLFPFGIRTTTGMIRSVRDW